MPTVQDLLNHMHGVKPPSRPKKWMGSLPVTCDVCNRTVTTPTFIDGKTHHGPWALMCESCFAWIGVGLGTGRGQSYNSLTGEKISG